MWCFQVFNQEDDLFAKLNQFLSFVKNIKNIIKKSQKPMLLVTANFEYPGPQVVYANDSYCKNYGYSQNDILGKPIDYVMTPVKSDVFNKHLAKNFKTGKAHQDNILIHGKNYSEYTNITISPIYDCDGKISLFLTICNKAA